MRQSMIHRKTRETDISLTLTLDGGAVDVRTGVVFFDHMLTAFAHHGRFGLSLTVTGDLEVDAHHTVEDAGLALGQSLREALGGKLGIERFGHSYVPMDEALGFAAVDLSGRPYFALEAAWPQERAGDYDACLTGEFWRAVCSAAGLTLHARCTGENTHHMTEALFKACGRALRQACAVTGEGVNSTKGTL